MSQSRSLNIAVFASGKGSLFQHLLTQQGEDFNIQLLVSNNEKANVVEIANKNHVDFHHFQAKKIGSLISVLNAHKVELIVLAGFLKKIPNEVISLFPEKIINTHPSLLPKYGGKGMYGLRVHQSVLENKEIVSGCTTHFVTEDYDEGTIIRQQQVEVLISDTAEQLQERVKLAEQSNLLKTIQSFCNQ